MKKATKKDWDWQWKSFQKGIFLKVNQGVVEKIDKIFEKKLKRVKILEVGAGSGSDLVFLAQKGAYCTALDYSKEALEVCRKLTKSNGVKVKTVKADCRKMPFDDNSFDLVFSVGLLEHFKNPLPILREQIRVVKKGGRILIDVPQKYNLYTLVKQWRMWRGKYALGWETQYSVADLKKMLEGENVKIESFYGRESALTVKLPLSWRPKWQKIVRFEERLRWASYFCLNLGVVVKKQQEGGN